MPRVVIDNQEVDVVAGSNLLAAARKLGLDLPALCYHPACEPNTACMACVVRLKDSGRIVPSCATPAEDGLQIESETEEVRALRRTALELLLSEHCFDANPPDGPNGAARTQPADWPNCECAKSDVCRLRKYSLLYGADPGRFPGARRPHRTLKEHPEVTHDSGKCVLCGICVQLAAQGDERLGLSFVGRGFEMRVAPPLGATLDQALETTARRIAGACPTGAIAPRKSE
jgi:NADH dehydrogenase/NADH:ubiquinone oxidoreductase subunit G